MVFETSTFPTTIFESELEGLFGDNTILLAAQNINIKNLPDDKLTFKSGNGTKSIRFLASNTFSMHPSDTIETQGRNLEISGNKIEIGNISSNGGDVTLKGSTVLQGNSTISPSGDITVGNINTAIGISSDNEDGSIVISPNGDITTEKPFFRDNGNLEGGGIVNISTTDGSVTTGFIIGEALTIRAGVTELENNPQSENLGSTVFTSTTNPSSQANIQVGDIYASKYVALSAKGDVVTGSITTEEPLTSEAITTDSVNITSTNGKVIVDYIQVLPSFDNNSFLGNININSSGVFQAKGSIQRGGRESFSFGFNSELKTKASVITPGNISIKHGVENFQYAIELKKDSDGKLIFIDFDSKERVVIADAEDGGGSTILEFEDGRDAHEEGVGRIETIELKEGEFAIPENSSYTVGGIFIQGGTDLGLYGSFQDTELPNSGDINVTQLARKKPPESPEPPELNKDKTNNICSPQSSTVALNSEASTRDVSSKNNPCQTTNDNDKNNILKVIPDNRFNSNSALPTSLFKLGEK